MNPLIHRTKAEIRAFQDSLFEDHVIPVSELRKNLAKTLGISTAHTGRLVLEHLAVMSYPVEPIKIYKTFDAEEQ